MSSLAVEPLAEDVVTYRAAGSLVGMGATVPGVAAVSPTVDGADYKDFKAQWWTTGEVYVVRFLLASPTVPLNNVANIRPLALAYGIAISTGWSNLLSPKVEVVGVTVKYVGVYNYQVEVVLKVTENDHFLFGHYTPPFAAQLYETKQLPSGSFIVGDLEYKQLVNAGAIENWLSAPALFSTIRQETLKNGTTDAYARGDGLWSGSAANRQAPFQPVEQPPIVGPIQLPGAPGGPASESAPFSPSLFSMALVAGGIIFAVKQSGKKSV